MYNKLDDNNKIAKIIIFWNTHINSNDYIDDIIKKIYRFINNYKNIKNEFTSYIDDKNDEQLFDIDIKDNNKIIISNINIIDKISLKFKINMNKLSLNINFINNYPKEHKFLKTPTNNLYKYYNQFKLICNRFYNFCFHNIEKKKNFNLIQ